MDHCIFCRIVEGKIPSKVVWQDEDNLAFRDINPQAPVHVLVIPKRHVTGLSATGEADRELLGKLLAAGAAVARQEGIGEAFRSVINTGSAVGQTVFHLHLHILGGRPMHWPPG